MSGLVKRGDFYHYDFQKDGKRFQGSTKCKSRQDAQLVVDQIRLGIDNRNRGRDPGVYFLLSPSTKLIKIGCSANVSRRIEEIRAFNPEELELVGRIFTDRPFEAEKIIHVLYRRKNHRAEWFCIEQADVDFAVKYWDRLEDDELAQSRRQPVEDKPLYEIGEVAEIFAVSPSTVRNMIKRGELRTIKYGNNVRIENSELRDFVERAAGRKSEGTIPSQGVSEAVGD